MDIRIGLNINPYEIDREQWQEAFQDVFRILDYGQMAHAGLKVIDGHTLYCLSPVTMENVKYTSDHSEHNRKLEVNGDMVTGYNMALHQLFEKIDRYKMFTKPVDFYTSEPRDIIFSELTRKEYQRYHVNSVPYTQLWGGTTQGERGHIFLLAAACLLCDRFPEAMHVYGDITFGQCFEAVRIVKEALHIDIKPPVQCRATDLLDRLEQKDVEQASKLPLFMRLYCGPRKELASLLKERFSITELYDFLAWRFKHRKPHFILKKMFREGYSLEDIFRVGTINENGPQNTLEEMVKALIMGGVHLKEKDVYDMTEAREEDPYPDDISMAIVREKTRQMGMQNPYIDMYIPGNEMIRITKEVFPERQDIEAVYNHILQNKEDGKDEDFEKHDDILMVYNNLVFDGRQKEKLAEQFDIVQWKDLCGWEQGDTIEPSLLEVAKNVVRQISNAAKSMQHAYHDCDKTRRIQILLEQDPLSHYLPESTWIWLFENIMDDEIYAMYLGLVGIDMHAQQGSEVYQVFALNKAFYEYVLSLIKTE